MTNGDRTHLAILLNRLSRSRRGCEHKN
jgi:hypothetical protein